MREKTTKTPVLILFYCVCFELSPHVAAKSLVYYTRTYDTQKQDFADDAQFQVVAQAPRRTYSFAALTLPGSYQSITAHQHTVLLQEGDKKELARLPVECAADYY